MAQSGDSLESKGVKVILLGSSSAGKTSLVRRYTEDVYDDHLLVTIVIYRKLVSCRTHTFDIWDTAGEERFHSLTKQYYRDARAAILCYDITSLRDFNELRHFYVPLLDDDPRCLKIVVGTKLDKVESGILGNIEELRQVNRATGRRFARELNQDFFREHPDDTTVPFFETSSKTNSGVSEMFAYTFDLCSKDLPAEPSYGADSNSPTINVRRTQKTPPKRKPEKSCCS